MAMKHPDEPWDPNALARSFEKKCDSTDEHTRGLIGRLHMEPTRRTLQFIIDRSCAEADVYRILGGSSALMSRTQLVAELNAMRSAPPRQSGGEVVDKTLYDQEWARVVGTLITRFDIDVTAGS